MSKKNLTIADATKAELIQYFFQPDSFGGGFRIPAPKDKFLLWLKAKRDRELLDACDASADASSKALHEYVELITQWNEEKDLDKKRAISEKANEAYERFKKAEKRYMAIDKKLMSSMID